MEIVVESEEGITIGSEEDVDSGYQQEIEGGPEEEVVVVSNFKLLRLVYIQDTFRSA